MDIIVHSIESMATVDGPGVRYGIFLAGCPLRCAYCHNPDTWDRSNGQRYTPQQLADKVKRYRSYFKDKGGVTISGGEPLLQAGRLTELVRLLQAENINVALDTAGSIINEDVKQLLVLRPLLLTDIKMPDEERYKKYIGAELKTNQEFLSLARHYGCDVWVRYVVVKGVNDSLRDIKKICRMASAYPNIKKIQLLAYHNMGRGKYKKLGISYTLSEDNVPSRRQMAELESIVNDNFHP